MVAIDPAVSNNPGSDETGIVVAGMAADDHVFILDDKTARLGPLDWARVAVAAYRHHEADRIIAEANNGGDLVETTLRTVDRTIPFKKVHASRGKVIRAEPVSALYEQRKVHHVGTFSMLEDQMCAFTSDFSRSTAGYSPDRVDALCWAVTELAVKPMAPIAMSMSFAEATGQLRGQRALPKQTSPILDQQWIPPMMDMQRMQFLKRAVESDLLKRVRPDTPQTAAFRGAITGCFGLLEQIVRERSNVNQDSRLGVQARKTELNRIVQERLAREFADLTRSTRKLRGQVNAQRKASPHSPLAKDIAALQEDVSTVEAAMYFARRELEPASGLSTYGFDTLVEDIDGESVR